MDNQRGAGRLSASSGLLYTTADVVVMTMNIFDFTPQQLKRAASLKEQIEALNKQLLSLLDGSSADGAASRKHTMSTAVKRKIAAAQRARWASLRRAKSAARSVQAPAKKNTMSAAARARMSAKLKAYWAKKKAGKK
jgi:dihydroxyacetone kinase